MQQILIEQANVALFTAATETKENLDSFLKQTLANHRLQTQLPDIVTFLGLTPQERLSAEARLKVIATLNVFCSNVHDVLRLSCGLLDVHGQNVLDSNPAYWGHDESQYDYFQEVQAFNLPYISKIMDAPDTNQTWLHFSYPIRNANGKFIGVLRVRYDALALQNIIVSHNKLAGKKSFAILVDEHGQYLAHSLSPHLVGTNVTSRSTNLYYKSLNEIIQTQLFSSPFFTAEVMNPEPELVAGALVKLEQHPWAVMFVQPRDIFLMPVRTQLKTAFGLAILIVFGVILVAMSWGYYLTHPITALTQIAQRIDNGELELRAEVTTQDEIGRLALAFNNMTTKLQELIQSLRQRNEELAQKNEALQELNRLKDEFLANTSHELRTPINGIIGLTEAMIAGAMGTLTLPQIENLSIVVSSGQRLAHLIDDLLDFSRSKHQTLSLNCEPIHLYPLVEAVIAMTRPTNRHKPITFINKLPPDLPPLQADTHRVEQILHNLIGNAAKFTPQGEITISARHHDEKFLSITVTDTGIGILEEDYDRIFLPFEQVDGSTIREHGGTGLGLAITKQLVELHGGKIRVISTPTQGSQFTFTLPISDQTPAATSYFTSSTTVLPPTGSAIGTSTEGEHHILVVDDEMVNRQVLVNQLKLHNYRVTTTGDGVEALKVMETLQTRVDLILLDIMMPHMSGYDVCSRLRRYYSPLELPIIMLTAKNQPHDLVRGFDVGANDYLTKPFLQAELLARTKTQIQLTDMRKLNRAKDRFFSIVAHDLKGPFMPLLGTSEVLAEMSDTLERPEIKELSESIYRSAKNLHNLLEGLLHWGRLQIGRVQFEPESFDLNEQVEINIQLLSEIATHKEINLRFESPPEPTLVYGDKNMVDTVVRNLVSNALKFTPTGGYITLEITTLLELGWAEVTVRDTGVGIPEEDLAKLFKIEYLHSTTGTANEPGTGLGLIMCKDMVEQNGGQIGVASQVGQGTTFKFTVPLVEEVL